ncbi:MAG: uracil-DNA glycosylase family protein [Fusobacteriaceae bacterium]
MDIESLWEEMIFEVGTIGKHLKDKKTMIGAGNHFTADLILIGDESELFLDEEFRTKEGSSGEFLKKLLNLLELEDEDFYLTTLSKSNYKLLTFSNEDQELLLDYLKMQISIIKPKIIVAFGADVASYILGRDFNFAEEKGKLISIAGDMKLIATYAPGFALKSRNEAGKNSQVAKDFWNDLKLAKSYMVEE